MINMLKFSTTALLVSTVTVAQADFNILNDESGNLSMSGDIELDLNYQNRESNQYGDDEFNQNGRILVEFAGEKIIADGHYVSFKAQPLFETTGDVALDDAYFEFGKKDAWAIKIGRFEGYDMFPVGQDVFLEYSGDTSNELYTDGAAYSYQMKEARGRGSDGQIMYNQTFGNLYVELSSMIGDRSVLFTGQYHGQKIDENNKDAFLLRPVIAYQMGDFSIAASLETNLVSDAVTANDIDISDRTGYGLTGLWSNGNWVVNANFAYLDAVDENNMSIGVNTLWKNFGLGYVHAENEYENKELSGWAEGDVNVSTWYASYEFKDVLNVEEFSILLGTYFTSVSNDLNQQVDTDAFAEEDDLGARVRIVYNF